MTKSKQDGNKGRINLRDFIPFVDDTERSDSGFGTSFTSADTRLMNRDGSLNVSVKGLDTIRRFNLYKEFIKLSSLKFYFSILVIYIFINAVFAWIYFSIGLEGLSSAKEVIGWWDAFFFSTQTFTTVGFGHISPNSMLTNVVASSEAFVGLLFFAVATGLVYGRFSTSKVALRFSKNMLISDFQDGKALMVRLANVSATELSELEALIIMSYVENDSFNRPIRRYKTLPLELQKISLLTTSWTIVHKITPESPCRLISTDESIQGVEFMLFITAFDEVFDQKVKVRTSYLESDLISSARFLPITSHANHKTIVDLDKLNEYELISD